jgi:transposase
MAAVPEECPVELVVGDRAYDSDEIREGLLDADIIAAIPARSNRRDPPELQPGLYRERNRVERLVGKLKQFRRVATRYDKLAVTFLSFVQLAAAFVMVR